MLHSIRTVIYCLRPEDSICLIVFDDHAEICLPPITMDDKGKKQTLDILNKIRTGGSTNLYDGLYKNISQNCDLNKNIFSLLLSDGEPNISPPRGEINEFSNYINEFG